MAPSGTTKAVLNEFAATIIYKSADSPLARNAAQIWG